MKKESLASRIKNYLRKHGGWVHSGEIERLTMQAGYKASNGSRRCREMTSGLMSNGKTCPIVLEKKEEKGSVLYRYKPKYETKQVPVVVEREDGSHVAIYKEKLFEII